MTFKNPYDLPPHGHTTPIGATRHEREQMAEEIKMLKRLLQDKENELARERTKARDSENDRRPMAARIVTLRQLNNAQAKEIEQWCEMVDELRATVRALSVKKETPVADEETQFESYLRREKVKFIRDYILARSIDVPISTEVLPHSLLIASSQKAWECCEKALRDEQKRGAK